MSTTVTLTSPQGVAFVTGTSNTSQVKVSVQAGLASGTGTSNTPFITNPSPHATTATGTGTANNIGVAVSVPVGIALGSGVANNPSPGIGVGPVTAGATSEQYLTYASTGWWNSSYHFRHQLDITNFWEDAAIGHAVQFNFSLLTQYDYGKTRFDYEDVEVIYNIDPDHPTYIQLARQVTNNYVRFYLIKALEKGEMSEEHYFIYFGNWDLNNTTERPNYEENLWPISKLVTDKNLAYTRPGEYWIDGKATDRRAVATLYFYGTRVRIQSVTNTSSGIAEVSIDDGSWHEVDLYAPTESTQVVFENSTLNDGKHKIQIRPSGDKNPISTNEEINFVSIDYLTTLYITDRGEEVMNVDWASVMSGATF